MGGGGGVEERYVGPLVPYKCPIFISLRDLTHQAQFISVTCIASEKKFE